MRGELKLLNTDSMFDANAVMKPSRAASPPQDLIGAVSDTRGDPILHWLEQFVADLSDAAILVDVTGKRFFDNSPHLLETDPDGASVAAEIRATVTRLAAALKARGRRGTFTDVTTRSGRYRLRGTVVPDMGGASGVFALLQVDQIGARLPSASQARAAFRLTARETEISLLLSQRMTNTQISARLGISAHTTRRHTESVFRKLGVRSRGDVITALHDARRWEVT